MRTILVGLIAIAASNIVNAGNVTIPHSFSANTPAKADEVNANFSAVKSSIDDNDARITTNTGSLSNVSAATTANSSAITQNSADIAANRQSIDQNANAIGTNTSDIAQNTANVSANSSDILTNSLDIRDIQTTIATNSTAIAGLGSIYVKAGGQSIGLLVGSSMGNNSFYPYRVLSDTDYVFEVDEAGKLDGNFQLFYELPNCTGQIYASTDTTHANQGYVFTSRDPADPIKAYYLPSNTAYVNVTTQATRTVNGCSTGLNTHFVFPAFPNDPAVTGVPGGSFPTPITIGH